MIRIRKAESDAELRKCFPILAELRPHLSESDFLAQVQRQRTAGYEIVCVEQSGKITCIAGYRISENLAWGKFLYVDDLVTAEKNRSQGHGDRLFVWLVAEARAHGCDQFHLDSGVQRFDAHRFYLANRMVISSHHFRLTL